MASDAAVSSGSKRLRYLDYVGQALYILRRWPIIPLIIIAALIVCAAFAPYVAPYDPEIPSFLDRNDEPIWYADSSGDYILGADPIGRDVLSRIIYGARVSMTLAGASIAIGLLVGTTVGLLAGYLGGVADEVLMRIIDVNSAIPYILVALVIVVVLGQSFTVLIVVLALGAWPQGARLVRGQTLQLKTMDYVALARVSGASNIRILYKHLLPGVSNTVVVVATLSVGQVILAESILSYLGAGVPPPTPAWGRMVADGRLYLTSAWWVASLPGLAVFLTVLAFNFLGDWLRDRWDPRLRQLD